MRYFITSPVLHFGLAGLGGLVRSPARMSGGRADPRPGAAPPAPALATPSAAPPPIDPPVAELREAGKRYPSAEGDVVALQPTNLAIRRELTIIRGPSGSGKTTLLSLLGCITFPSSGEVRLAGRAVPADDPVALARLRLERIGFVFQGYNLLAPLTAEENVRVPLDLLGVPRGEARNRALDALERMGLAPQRRQLPRTLSGGQQQRVAIARALVTGPSLVLCDEPTAALDAQSAGRVMHELAALAGSGTAVVVVTHDPRLDAYGDRLIEVRDGQAFEQPREVADVA